MRSRHSAAILEFLGVTDTIARDVDDYVAIAARLAHDPAGRARLAERIRAAKGRIFCDDAPVRALEDFMLGLFARA
jgi:predicted O-linked N-acetylglucosamine transferase (SPINDLY family)